MTTATLAGIPLKTTPAVGWDFTPGVTPYERVFRVSSANADKLAKITDDVTLVVEAAGRPRLEVKKLSIMSIEPTNHRDFKFVRVSDSRWKWPSAFVTRQYNVPRRTGDYKRLSQDGVPVQVQQVVAEVAYARWSLYPRDNPTAVWTAHLTVADILEAVVGAGNYRVVFPSQRKGTVVGARFFADGASAIHQALAFLPGSNVKLDEEGRAVVYDELDGSDARLLEKGPVYRGPSLSTVVDWKRRRPIRVDVLFEREVELRFDSKDEAGTTESLDDRLVENVAPLPDVSLTINGQTYASGTWVTFDALFGYWPVPGSGRVALTHTTVQQKFMFKGFLDSYARPNGATEPDVPWAQRVACVLNHYRQTYRVTSRWMDRIKAIHPYRIALMDPVKGTRARASVFSNYAVKPTVMGLVKAAAEGSTARIWNVNGYSALLSGSKQSAPATISIEDDDQGIFTINYALDRNGEVAKIYPSAVVGVDSTGAKIASYDLRKMQKGRGEALATDYCRLKSAHKLAVVLTVEPGAPNDERICHLETVGPEAASKSLGVEIGACNGPVWTILVKSRFMKARTEWLDTYADNGATDEAFGLTAFKKSKEPQLSKLGQPTNWREVREVAIAAASALYATLLDHPEGQHVIRLDPSIRPTGHASSVEHSLRPDGGTRTTITFPRTVHGVDIAGILPAEIQKRILGSPDATGAP